MYTCPEVLNIYTEIPNEQPYKWHTRREFIQNCQEFGCGFTIHKKRIIAAYYKFFLEMEKTCLT